MIEDAEKFQEQDEAKQSSMKHLRALEDYLHKVNKTLKKSDVKKNMPAEMRDDLLDDIDDLVTWCEDHQEEDGAVYEKKLRDFETKAELKIAPFRVFDGRKLINKGWG